MIYLSKLLIIELPCQRNNGGCQHICTDTLNGPLCSCRKGYVPFTAGYCAGMGHSNLYNYHTFILLQRSMSVLSIKIYVELMFVLTSQEIIYVYVLWVTSNLQIGVVKVYIYIYIIKYGST